MSILMAADTVPAAVPDPNDPPAASTSSGPQPGLFSSMLAAVEPARPAAFDLQPPAADGVQDTAGSASSAAYHGDDITPQNGTVSSGNARQPQSIWRAWLLAGAERWKKGAGANVKRLELEKAKAQARQVKETRQVSVNRSGGLFGNSSGASRGGNSGSGKSLNSKTSGGGASKGPKNTHGGARHGSAGRSGSGGSSGGPGGGGGRGPASTGAGHGGSHGAKGHGGKSGHGTGSTKRSGGHSDSHSNKPWKTNGPKGSKGGPKSGASGGSSGSGKTGPQGPAGSAGKNAPAGGKNAGAKGDSSKEAPGSKKVSLEKTSKKPGKKADGQSPKAPSPKNSTAPAPAPGSGGAPGSGTAEKPGKTNKTKATTQTGQTKGKSFSTRESREAGYRDGTRAARATAHVRAYRDGVKDGYRDTSEAAEREKTRLDKAHQDRKQQREKDQPVTAPASSADYHQPQQQPQQVQPVQVKNVDATHVQLGDGAAREYMSRGEVRSLKAFERRLATKAEALVRVAEETKRLKAHADQQAKQALQLLEQAKAVKGGDKLVTTLARLHEAAAVQAGKAEEIHKRAVRGAEACKTVLANVETRYGDIYRAVVNSDETAPAELDFYKD